MHHIRHQNNRYSQISEETVSLLDEGKKSKLCYAEINETADKCDHNLASLYMAGCAEVFSNPSDTRFTIAATIFTAVETAPSMISMEMSGVINPLPTPF